MKMAKRYLLIFLDLILINTAILFSFLLRFDFAVPINYINSYKTTFYWISFIIILFMLVFNIYKKVWYYGGINDYLSLAYSLIASYFTIGVIFFLLKDSITPRYPLSVSGLSVLLIAFLLGGYRIGIRVLKETSFNKPHNQTKVLIVGAGERGAMIVKEMRKNRMYNPVGFVDDKVKDVSIHGVNIIGKIKDIPRLAKKHNVHEILIALPLTSGKIVRDIITMCKRIDIKFKIIPSMNDIINDSARVDQIRNVEIEDLLMRKPSLIDYSLVSHHIKNKVILVTGAGGSIGSEICRQISKFNPSKLILLGRGENSIFEIEQELRGTFPNLDIVPCIANIENGEKLKAIFQVYRPEIVFHTAAHKHVYLMEHNPEEAVKTNIFGTKNLAELADMYKVKNFVFISSDKAVNPTNIMGATKRVGEMIVQSLSNKSKTNFIVVRFGNVLGSRGSAIPLFKRQIARGGPLTLTHPDMVRYFMTIPEATQLVIQSGAIGKSGEIYLLDMGNPVKITDLANNLIRLSGFEPGKDIKIKFIGKRKGEKIVEELLTKKEGATKTDFERIFTARPDMIDEKKLYSTIDELQILARDVKRKEIYESLKEIVPGFSPEM